MNPEQISATAQAKQSQSLQRSQKVEDWEEFAEELSDAQLASLVGGTTQGSSGSSTGGSSSSGSSSSTTTTTTTTKTK